MIRNDDIRNWAIHLQFFEGCVVMMIIAEYLFILAITCDHFQGSMYTGLCIELTVMQYQLCDLKTCIENKLCADLRNFCLNPFSRPKALTLSHPSIVA